jgi:hypothetical protein
VPEKIIWTDGQDTQIRRLRTEGASCDVIALLLGVTQAAVAERARHLGVDTKPVTDPDQADRPPMPAGHPASWGALTRGTTLQDVPFRGPNTIR